MRIATQLQIVLLAGLMMFGSDGRDIPPSQRCGGEAINPALGYPIPTIVYWDCPEEFKTSVLNTLPLQSFLLAFWKVEGRLPLDLDEFLRSPYMALDVSEIQNPYKKRPVRILESSKPFLDANQEERKEYLGDILYHKSKRGDFRSFVSVVPLGMLGVPGPRTDFIGIMSAGDIIPPPEDLRDTIDVDPERRKAAYEGLTNEEKALFAMCTFLSETLAAIAFYKMERLPERISERAKFVPLINKLKNPYTGAPLQEVTEPSPGNFMSFRRYDNGIPESVSVVALCFDATGKLIKPQRAYWQVFKDSEDIRLKAGLPPSTDLRLPPGL